MKYSILIPTYNRLNDLRLCLNSVFAAIGALPERFIVEVLVSDNASTDGTEAYLNNLIPSSNKIKLMSWTNLENIGARANVKKLISAASGDYLFFLTDDDILLPGALVCLDEFIARENCSFIKSGIVTYLVKSKKCFYYGVQKDIVDSVDHANFILIMEYANVISGCVLKKNADVFMTLMRSENVYPSIEACAINAGRCGFIAEPLVFHQWENQIFWEKDVDMTSEESRVKHTRRDAQLALLHIPEDFFDLDQVRLLYRGLLGKYGYIESALSVKLAGMMSMAIS